VPDITHKLCDWALGLGFDDLPAPVVNSAQRLLLDSLGCAIGALDHDDVRIMQDYIRNRGGRPQATCFGSGFRTDVVDAALLNALLVRALDFNDIYWRNDPCHPSDLIPAALALGESQRCSGRELIAGIVISYELLMRWSEAAEPGIRERGWHHATLTSLVAPIVAARMLGLSQAQAVHAVGISAVGSMCLGAAVAGRLSMMKNTVDPLAVAGGVRAALLAQGGYAGPTDVVEGKEGLVHGLGRGWQLDRLTADLGTHYRIGQCALKAYPVEWLIQSPVTAALRLVGKHDIRPAQVAAIRIETIARAADILADPAKYRPTSRETADHSLPYCIAAAITDRTLTPASFDAQRFADPALIALMDRMTESVGEGFETLFPAQHPARVTIVTTDGRTLAAQVNVPHGDPHDPLTDQEIEAKFRRLARPHLSDAQCDRVREAVLSLEEIADVRQLVELLVAPQPA
jgi:2-methylcitrate dehydratase